MGEKGTLLSMYFFYLCDYTTVLIFILALKRQVVFHAELGSYKTYQKGSIWIYDKVNTNVGNAYDPSTGKFTAPTNGIYQFNWYTLSDPKATSHAGLFVNGEIKARQASNNSGGSYQLITAGSSIALLLSKGDEVYIRDGMAIRQIFGVSGQRLVAY